MFSEMIARLIILVALINISGCSCKLLNPKRSDNVLDLIRGAGYKGEAHKVVTDDGYFLKVHHMLPKLNETKAIKKPVFLMHGIVATAADFLVTGTEIALAFLLADNGYDVWLGEVSMIIT